VSRFDRWIFDSYVPTADRLGVYRIVVALFVLLVLSPGHTLATSFQHMADVPPSFFVPPPGPLRLFSGFPPAAFWSVLLLTIHLSAAALLLGYRTRAATLVLGSALLVGFGFWFSFGKVNHPMLLLLTPFVMACAGWGRACSVDAARSLAPSRRPPGWPLTLLALLLGFAMFTAGVPKLVSGWLDPTTAAVRGQFFNHFVVNGRQDLLAAFYWSLDAPWFWEVLDWVTIVFEIGFLLAVRSPVATRVFVCIAVLFHLNVMLMFNIPFIEHLAVYAAFFDGSFLLPKLATRAKIAGVLRRPFVAEGLVLGIGTASFALGSPLHGIDDLVVFPSGLLLHEAVLLGGASVLAVAYLLRLLRRPPALVEAAS
jgi:uncharacterized membrane protein YphA (DoxX/SURF4 family)